MSSLVEQHADQLARLSPGDREEAIRELAQLEKLVSRNPLLTWRPKRSPVDGTWPQARWLENRDRVKLLGGGNQAGKTEVGVVDDLIQCVDREALPRELRAFKHWEPPFACRIVAMSFKQLNSTIFKKLSDRVPLDQLQGGSWGKAYSKDLQTLRFKNGSTIEFLTADMDPEKHYGATLDRVHFDEEPKGERGYQIWRDAGSRVLARNGQLTLTMTPLLGLSWAYEEIYERRDEPGTFAMRMSMLDNPTLSKDAIRQRLANLTDDEMKAIRDGEFVHFKGRIFDEFDETKHLVDPPSKDHVQGLDVVVGIDPGLRRTGLVWCGFDRDNSMLSFDESYLADCTVPQVCDEIRRRNEQWGVRPQFYVIDPSARNRSLNDAERVEAEYLRFGIPAVPGQNDVEAGIFQLKRRLQSDPPSWLVARQLEDHLGGCPVLKWEIGKYRSDIKDDGRFAVVKRDDHLIDPTRYVAMERPWGPRPATRRSNRAGWVPGTAPWFEGAGPLVNPPMSIFS